MEIPVLLCDRTAGTHGVGRVPGAGRPVQAQQGEGRKIRPPTRRCDAERKEVAKRAGPVPRKAAIVHKVPVPQTDTGGWGENPKAGGRSIVKELGKMAP